MRTDDFKKAIIGIEKKLKAPRSGDERERFEDVHREAMTTLYFLLHSDVAVSFFSLIYWRTGASNVSLAKETENYLTEVWMEAYEHYDPLKGELLSFLTTRLQNRIIDDERKMGGIVGLPRKRDERARIRLLGIDHAGDGEDLNGSTVDERMLNQAEFEKYGRDMWFEKEHGNLLAGDLLYALARQILSYSDITLESERDTCKVITGRVAVDKATATMRSRYNRFFYYRLFYSSDVLSFLKEGGSTAAFHHEREEMQALHFDYTNFCTDRATQYRLQEDITPTEIIARPLARNEDVLPHALLSKADRGARIAVPIQNEVVRGYMERVEGRAVSSSNISQMKRKYLYDISSILKNN